MDGVIFVAFWHNVGAFVCKYLAIFLPLCKLMDGVVHLSNTLEGFFLVSTKEYVMSHWNNRKPWQYPNSLTSH